MSFDDMDPMFRIGMMLGNAYGNIWANNATKRQEKRADKIFDDIQNANEVARIAQMRNANIADETATDVVADRLSQQAGTQGAQQATGMNLGVLKGVDYLGQADKYAQPQDQYQLSVPSPLEQLRQSQIGGKDYSVNKALQANQKAIQANEAQQAAMTPQQRATASFDPTLTATSVRKKLRDAGIAQDVIDERMKEYSKTIAEKARAYYQPGILKDMYYGMDVADDKGNVIHVPPNAVTMASALTKIQEYAQYDPEGAKTLMSGVVDPKTLYQYSEEERRYARNRADKKADATQARAWKKEDRQDQFKQQVAIAAIKGAGKGGSNKYSISTSDYKEALKRIGEIEAYYEEKRAENPDFNLPSSMQEEWEDLNSIKRAYRSERNNGGTVSNSSDTDDSSNDTTEAVDWNDWNSINAGINQAQKDGYSTSEILSLVKSKLGADHPWYQNIASSFDHEAAKQKAELEDAENKRRLEGILHPTEYAGNTTEQTIADIAAIGDKFATGKPIWNLAHR